MTKLKITRLQLGQGINASEPAMIMLVMELVLGLSAKGLEKIIPSFIRSEVGVGGIQRKLDMIIKAVKDCEEHIVEFRKKTGAYAKMEAELLPVAFI